MYEVHITVDHLDIASSNLKAFTTAAEMTGAKLIRIANGMPVVSEHHMTSCKLATRALAEEHIKAVLSICKDHGVMVLREKLERRPEESDIAVMTSTPGNRHADHPVYFESHFDIVTRDLGKIQKLVDAGYSISRNLDRPDSELAHSSWLTYNNQRGGFRPGEIVVTAAVSHKHHLMVTHRSTVMEGPTTYAGYVSYVHQRELVKAALTELGLEPTRVVDETALYDTNPELDHGWLNQPV